MKIGIMQPYFFPYIGYWQLIAEVDRFIVFDNVNFIKRGWINRNRILSNTGIRYFNLPLHGASQNKKINELYINNDIMLVKRNIDILYQSYHKAPHFNAVMELVKRVLLYNEEKLGEYLLHLIIEVCEYLGIQTPIHKASLIQIDDRKRGEDKIIALCRELHATEYVNAIGGRNLYHKNYFAAEGMELHFIESTASIYEQFQDSFQENLSIIDMLMFCGVDGTRKRLNEYRLV